MGLSLQDIKEMAASLHAKDVNEKSSPAKPSPRVKVRVGSKNIGDMIGSNKITGLGKSFSQFIPDHETSAWGLAPGRDYRIDVQYAYFN